MKSKHQNKYSSKKLKNVNSLSLLNIEYNNTDIVNHLKNEYIHSKPYQHIVLNNLCNNIIMRDIHDEVTLNLKANFKETDLFKLFQTDDLGNYDNKLINSSKHIIDKDLPHLLTLKNAIYSKEFRSFISQIIPDVGELSDRIDCSVNAYANSCHLLCHDDVIGTRRVSYIIYLTDPDDPWLPEDGGSLELYPLHTNSDNTNSNNTNTYSNNTNTNSDNNNDNSTRNNKDYNFSESKKRKTQSSAILQGIPANIPTVTIVPRFNSMVLFAVQPGRSYHSVQEVFVKDKPRISISGWFHGATPPPGADLSSLKQIMTIGDDHRRFLSFRTQILSSTSHNPSENDDKEKTKKSRHKKNHIDLTKEEINVLKEYINSNYLTIDAMKDINKQFCENSSLQLHDFIKSDLAYKITKKLIEKDQCDKIGHGLAQLDYHSGINDSWQLVGPPHKRRHLIYSHNEEIYNKSHENFNDIGYDLHIIKQHLFQSNIFAKYLNIITSLNTTGYRDEIRRFRAGLDYTVAHYGILTKKPRLDATLCFVNDNKSIEDKIINTNNTTNSNNKNKAKKNNVKVTKVKVPISEEEEEELSYEELWEDGEIGGFECYIEADEDPENAEAAEVYRNSYQSKENKTKKENSDDEEEDTSLLSVSACNNTLNLVMRDQGVMRFIKYISANAPSSRFDISMEYEIKE